jgi:uncharacterized membrane protein YciS (DUF1049 family)
MELIAVLLVFGFFVGCLLTVGEYLEMRAERRKLVELRRRIFGNVVDLREWKATKKRASGISWKR